MMPNSPARRWDWRTWAWLVAVVGGAALVLLPGLGGGTMQVYDEGLYGKLARNAMEHGEYRYAVDQHGAFYPGFSKPPLALWAVVASFKIGGISLGTLRLPFALSMLISIGVSFAWGRTIGGLPLALAWSGALLACSGTTRWGRTACIEPMLIAWVLTALWAYHEALKARGRAAWGWSGLTGIALALAVATKQLTVGLAIIPIVALQLWRGREPGVGLRLGLSLVPPAVLGGGWLWLVTTQVGERAFEVFVRNGVMRRMAGFDNGHNIRSLNEVSTVVAEACAPFVWELGVVGLLLLVLSRPHARRTADGALLLPLLWVTTVLIYDNASNSMLPWYAFNVVVPLTGGLGILMAGIFAPGDMRWAKIHLALGAVTLMLGSIGALLRVVSQLDVALGLAVVLGAAMVRSDEGRALRRARKVLVPVAALAIGVGIVVRRPSHHPLGGHEQLMRGLSQRGIETVHVDRNTRVGPEHAWGTYYGPRAERVSRPPWVRGRTPEAYISGVIWPSEFVPANGSAVVRAPGLMALVGGHLDRTPWETSTLPSMLAEGPITFEAEDVPGSRADTVVDDPSASGGRARAIVPVRRLIERPFVLSGGPGLRLPKGRYSADFVLRWGCGTIVERVSAVLQVAVNGQVVKTTELACPGADLSDYRSRSLEFLLVRPARVDLKVNYRFGQVWHDRTTVHTIPAASFGP